MTTTTTTAESDAYLAAVKDQLSDLPEEERTDLLEDLAQHLAEISANRQADEPDLSTLLGAPERYAAELRAAADLSAKAPREVFPGRLPTEKFWRVRTFRGTSQWWPLPAPLRCRSCGEQPHAGCLRLQSRPLPSGRRSLRAGSLRGP